MAASPTSPWPLERTYPRLRPALPVLRRGPDEVQIGVDAPDAVIVTGVGSEFDWLFSMLDGCHHVRALSRSAAVRDVDPTAVSRLLHALESAGLLLEGGRLGLPAAGPPHSSCIRLVGAGALGTAVARLLVAAGVGSLFIADHSPVDPTVHPTAGALPTNGEALASELAVKESEKHGPRSRVSVVNHWSKPDAAVPDLTVVTSSTWEPDRVVADGLVRADQPHLFVRPQGASGVVGPLVVPGHTACIRCTDLTRASADAAWPTLLRQLSRLHCTPGPAILAWAAATTVAHALAFVDGALPESYGRTLELGTPDYQLRWRSWPAHGDCGCWNLTAE
ncbi:MAG TPA: ThiF family adenylyltransferase [Dermatophilaceae bacterium]|nr:ThiF family adenylyltransferase [Dermatophilaceae bacterium]